MVTINPLSSSPSQRGTTLIEVLVTLVIIAIGLLGLAQLQVRVQASEMEAYQRAQALVLLNDMVSRISTNRAEAAQYVTDLGAGMTCPTDVSSRRAADLKEWCNALQGAGETSGGNRVGALIGGRGCIESPEDNAYLITVAWQGLSPISAPPGSVACGEGEYDGATGSDCADDRCRRTVTARVLIGAL